MAIKTVLSILKSSKFEQDLKGAIDLCVAQRAHLTALAVSIGAPPTLGEYDAALSSVWIAASPCPWER